MTKTNGLILTQHPLQIVLSNPDAPTHGYLDLRQAPHQYSSIQLICQPPPLSGSYPRFWRILQQGWEYTGNLSRDELQQMENGNGWLPPHGKTCSAGSLPWNNCGQELSQCFHLKGGQKGKVPVGSGRMRKTSVQSLSSEIFHWPPATIKYRNYFTFRHWSRKEIFRL